MRTAEFYSPKHIDKICDIISDTVVEEYRVVDIFSRCNIKTLIINDTVLVIGNVISDVNIDKITIQNVVRNIEYGKNVVVDIIWVKRNTINKVNTNSTVIGFAARETTSLLPFEYDIAKELNKFIFNHYPTSGKTQVHIEGFGIKVCAFFKNSDSTHISQLIDEFFEQYTGYNNKVQPFKVFNKYINSVNETTHEFYNSIGYTNQKVISNSYGPRIPYGNISIHGKDIYNIEKLSYLMARKIAVESLKKYDLVYSFVELTYADNQELPINARIKGNDKGISSETGTKLFKIDDYDLSVGGIIKYLDIENTNLTKLSEWGYFGNSELWDKEI